jgi:iron complex outermembrane recepter protein
MRFSILLLASSLLASPAFAQAPTKDAGDHHLDDPEIVVTAVYSRNMADILAGTSVLTGEDLKRDRRPTIGETLARLPGVSATSFGPNASRPTLRGFQGERVRVLADGIGSFDVSNTSVDHAVVINPLTADRIEVLRGPSALLFGSSAIGGVVNVIDSRIPRTVPDAGFHADAIATFGSAAKERSFGGRVDLGLGNSFVIHLDGSYTKTGDLRGGGFVLTEALREEAAESDESEIADLANLKGRIPNSAARTWEIAGGFAYITPKFNFGASVSHYDSLYGIPVRYPTSEDEGEDTEGLKVGLGGEGAQEVRLDVKQTRFDVRGEYAPESGFFDAIKVRGGYANYKHNELEETGEIGTTFRSKGSEARLELVQRDRNGWRGAIGAQFLRRSLNIVGEEKFLPRSTTRQLGLFTVQSFDLGDFRAEAGARIESSRLRADADVDLGNPNLARNFTALSGSLGGNYEIAGGVRLGVNLSYTERAPSAEELFSNGPHAGTQAFEVGNPLFDKERSTGVELVLKANSGPFRFSGSLYHSWFSNFIYEQPDGTEEDDLPVFNFLQDKARHYGFEAEAAYDVVKRDDLTVTLDMVADQSRTRIVQAGPDANAPRIPALRLLGGIEANADKIGLRAEVERVAGQRRIAAFETSTKGYTLVNASLTARPWGAEKDVALIFSFNNIFDVDARRHASFLKDYAPLVGRDFRATLQFGF